MAERRMITKPLLMSNRYLKISNDSKALYQYLLVFADDDGIVERSMMIDAPLQVDDSNYKELEQANLIINYNEQIKVIPDWNTMQTIRTDMYQTSKRNEVKHNLYLKTDFTYSTNEDDNVMISLDDWIASDRPKNQETIKQFQRALKNRNQERPSYSDL